MKLNSIIKYSFCICVILFASCGEPQSNVAVKPEEKKESIVEQPKENQKAELEGKQLIAGSDCRACHGDNTKIVGPSYMDIAAKYTEKDIETLVDKIIKGGQGVWGQIPMSPHPNLSKEEAEAMVKYILTIKG